VLARLRGDDGANAVEFALVLPILIVLIFGILWGGIALNQKLTITQAAREGARFGATFPFEGAAPDGDWFAAIAERIERSATGELTDGLGGFCIRLSNPDGDSAWELHGAQAAIDEIKARYGEECEVEADATGVIANRARVEVVTARPARLDFIFYNFNRFIFSDSVARYEPEIDD
jgi:hypothetical protein